MKWRKKVKLKHFKLFFHLFAWAYDSESDIISNFIIKYVCELESTLLLPIPVKMERERGRSSCHREREEKKCKQAKRQ